MADSIRSLQTFREVLRIERPTFPDDRGFFHEFFRLNELEQVVGRPLHFVQGNHSRSQRGVLRGIHVASYDKLIYVASGEVLAVIIDLRPDSPTFAQYEQLTLGSDGQAALFLPPGFGNSYLVTSPVADYLYLVPEYYDPTHEQTIRWDDPDLAVPWPTKTPTVSRRDQQGLSVRERFPERFRG